MVERTYTRGKAVFAVAVLGLWLLNVPLALSLEAFVLPWSYYAISGGLIALYAGYVLAFRSTFNLSSTVVAAVLACNAFFLSFAVWSVPSAAAIRPFLLFVLVHATPIVAYLGFRYVWWPYRREKNSREVTY